MRTKVTIRNNTHYRTADIKALVVACAKDVGRDRVYAIIGYTKPGKCYGLHKNGQSWLYVTGFGWFNSPTIQINVPKYLYDSKKDYHETKHGDLIQVFPMFLIERFAQVVVHEIHHNMNLRHKDMLPSKELDVSYTNGMRIRAKHVKPKKDIKVRRYEHAMEMMEKHEKKLKRERNLVKKWKTKVRYYERAYKYGAEKGE